MAKQKTLTPDPATTQIEVPKPPEGNGTNSPSPQPDGSARTIQAPAIRPNEAYGMIEDPLKRPPGAGALTGSRGVELRTMAEMWQFAGICWESRITPETLKNKEAVFIALQSGLECGLTPMQSIQNIYVVNGKPCLYGSVLIALCRTKGDWIEAAYSERIVGEGESRRGIVTVQRVGGSLMEKSFSVADARKAGLIGGEKTRDIWVKYTDDMLLNRARSRALKSVFSHHLHGIAIAEEQQDLLHNQTIEIQAVQRAPEDPVAALADTLGKRPEAVKPAKPEIGSAEFRNETWAAWFRRQIAEAVAAVDLEGLAKQIEEAHTAQRINVDEANALWAELDRRGKEFGAA